MGDEADYLLDREMEYYLGEHVLEEEIANNDYSIWHPHSSGDIPLTKMSKRHLTNTINMLDRKKYSVSSNEREYYENYISEMEKELNRRNKPMMQKNQNHHTCPFCGGQYTITSTYDDGYDYDGHQRGTRMYTPTQKGECFCPTAQAVKKIQVKPICLNCEHRKDNKCTNAERISTINKTLKNMGVSFTTTPSLEIDDLKWTCNLWRFNCATIMNYAAVIEKDITLQTTSNSETINPKQLFRKHKGGSRK